MFQVSTCCIRNCSQVASYAASRRLFWRNSSEWREMAGNGKVILHAFWSSSCAWRVRLALSHKEIPFEYKSCNLLAGEHRSEEYKKINPLQLVPCLEIDGGILNESIAIVEYLEERFPDKAPLLPKDLKKRAAIRAVVNAVTAGIQPLQTPRVLNVIAEKAGQSAASQWGPMWITKGFTALEQILANSAGKYSFGDEVTMADVFLAPQVFNAHAPRFNVDMEKFPTLERVYKNLLELELFSSTRPDLMPDYVPNQ